MSANLIHAETTGAASTALMVTSVFAPEVSWAITARETLTSAHPDPVFMGVAWTKLMHSAVSVRLDGPGTDARSTLMSVRLIHVLMEALVLIYWINTPAYVLMVSLGRTVTLTRMFVCRRL